jgi:hypothetical protein
MPAPFRRQPLQSPERPDTFFGLVAGLYVAALVSPGLLAAVALWLTSDAALLYLGLLGIITAVTTLVGRGVTRCRGLAERLGNTRSTWLLPILGGCSTLGYFVFATGVLDDAASDVGIAGFLTGMFAMLLGFALLAMSRSRYAKALVDEDAVALEWRAGWPERHRTWLLGGVAVVFVVSIVGFGLEATRVVDPPVSPWSVLPGVAAVAVSIGSERTYRVTPTGIERSLPAFRQFHHWSGFTGVAVTDELVVLRRQPWRLDFRCAREDIEDVDAVVATLTQYLDRVD